MTVCHLCLPRMKLKNAQFVADVRANKNISEERQLMVTDVCPGLLDWKKRFARVMVSSEHPLAAPCCGAHEMQAGGASLHQVNDEDKAMLVDPCTRNRIIHATRLAVDDFNLWNGKEINIFIFF